MLNKIINSSELLPDPICCQVVRTIEESMLDDKYTLQQVEKILNAKEPSFYKELLALFVDFPFNDEMEAFLHWQKILDHKNTLAVLNQRDMGLQVTIMDYFMNICSSLVNPIAVNFKIYQQTKDRAVIDMLTNLYNRNYLEEVLDRELSRCKRMERPLSIAMIDIDDFKPLNDHHGHSAADKVLSRVGMHIKASCRKEDIPCRYGGEEFVIIMWNTTLDNGVRVLERVRMMIKNDPTLKEYGVTFSAGISEYPIHGTDGKKLIYLADQAMYRAKHAGKDRTISADQLGPSPRAN